MTPDDFSAIKVPVLEDTSVRERTTLEKFGKQYPKMSQAFKKHMQDQLELIAGKMLDYGINNMKAGTNLETEEDVKFALEGIWFRISDKMARWQNLLRSGKKPNYESLYDTFMDISNYALFAQLISNGEWTSE